MDNDSKAIFAENLKELMDSYGVDRNILADYLDIKYTTISNWLYKASFPKSENLDAIARYFNVSVSSLLEDKSNSKDENNYVRVNVYGTVPAGIPLEAIENIDDWEDIPAEWTYGGKEYIGLKVKGDSMYPEYMDGDIVIVLLQSDFVSGQDCVVFINGYNATLKRCYKTIEGIQLKPLNNNYAPKTYGENDEPIQVLGVVKEIRRKVM